MLKAVLLLLGIIVFGAALPGQARQPERQHRHRPAVATSTFAPTGGVDKNRVSDSRQNPIEAAGILSATIGNTPSPTGSATPQISSKYSHPFGLLAGAAVDSADTARARGFKYGRKPGKGLKKGDGLLTSVETPWIDPSVGTFSGGITIFMGCSTPDAEVRYTTDGSTTPTADSTKYEAPFRLTSSGPETVTVTVRAIAFLSGEASGEATASISIAPPVRIATELLTGQPVQYEPYSFGPLGAAAGVSPYYWYAAPLYQEQGDASTFAEVEGPKGWNNGAGEQSWVLDLPFSFPFYGSYYQNCSVFDNGYIFFNQSGNIHPYIAVLGEDLDTNNGDIYVQSSTEAVTIRWQGVYTGTTQPANSSLTLYPNGQIRMMYGAGNKNGGSIEVGDGGDNYLESIHSYAGSMANAGDILFQPVLEKKVPGLRIDSDGLITGTPTESGVFTLGVMVRDSGGSWAVKDLSITVEPKVAAPVIHPPAGTYFDSVQVTLSTATAGATIRYTTDGFDPTAASSAYTGAFTLNSDTTVKARAFLDDYKESDIADASYEFKPAVKIITELLPLAYQYKAYQTTLAAESGTPPYHWYQTQIYQTQEGPASFAAGGTALELYGSGTQIQLPFRFPFYGSAYSWLEIQSNGYVVPSYPPEKMGQGKGVQTSSTFLSGQSRMKLLQSEDDLKQQRAIAPLWADIDTSSSGGVFVEEITGDDQDIVGVAIRWQGYYTDTNLPVNFSVALYSDGRILMKYGAGNELGGVIGISKGNFAECIFSPHSEAGSMGGAADILFQPTTTGVPGLSVSYFDGVISGTPAQSGDFTLAVAVQDSVGSVAVKAFKITVYSKAAQPVISPPGGQYFDSVMVSISTITPGATIRYTTNGDDPTASSTEYIAPFSLTVGHQTIKAKAFLTDIEDSEVASAEYDIMPSVKITTEVLSSATQYEEYHATLEATGGTPPLLWMGNTVGSTSMVYQESKVVSLFEETGVSQGEKYGEQFWELDLPFTFPFYGRNFNKCFVSNYGNVGFDGGVGSTGSLDQLKAAPMIAALWRFIYTELSIVTVYMDSQPDKVTIRWNGYYCNRYWEGGTINISLTLFPDGRILMKYGPNNESGGIIGISAGDGTHYLVSTKSQSGSMEQADGLLFTSFDVPGLMLSTDGVLSGTPQQSGTYHFTVSVMDSVGSADSKEYNLEVSSKVATPVFSPTPGRYFDSVQVSISTTTPGAAIHYTTDESEPTTASTEYNGPFLLTASKKVKAKAFLAGSKDSATAEADYFVSPAVRITTSELPLAVATEAYQAVLQAESGTLPLSWSAVSTGTTPPSWAVPGLTFSPDGRISGVPQQSGTYPIRVSVQDSAGSVDSKDYTLTVQPKVATPVIWPHGGALTAEDQVSIECATPGAAVYYTIDGSEPTTQSTPYTGAFALAANATVRARAFLAGYHESDIGSASFTFVSPGGTVPHSGLIEKDANWRAGYEHQVTGDVTVATGAILTIGPGVTVKFAANTALVVNGTLVAVGTESNHIHFHSEAQNPNAGDWKGLQLACAGGGIPAPLRLEYCEISHAVRGVSVETSCDQMVSVKHCQILNSSERGVSVTANGGAQVTVELDDNSVQYTGGPAIFLKQTGTRSNQGQTVYSKVTATIADSTLTDAADKGVFALSETDSSTKMKLTVKGTIIKTGDIISGKGEIKGCQQGIRTEGPVELVVESVHILNNAEYGISTSGGDNVICRLEGNLIESNGNYAIALWGLAGKDQGDQVISNNQVLNNSKGLMLGATPCARYKVTHNLVAYTNGVGIHFGGQCSELDLSGNDVNHNYSGIELSDDSAGVVIAWNRVTYNAHYGMTISKNSIPNPYKIHHNVIANNGDGDGNYNAGVSLSGGADKVVRFNHIFDNGGSVSTRHDLYLDNDLGYIDARYNWWGADTTAEMNSGGNPKDITRIYDRFDNPSNSQVDYNGWLTAELPLAEAPVCKITAPANGAIFSAGSPVHITGLALAEEGVEKVEISLNGSNWQEVNYSIDGEKDFWYFDWPNLPIGPAVIHCRFTHGGQTVETSDSTITITVPGPVITGFLWDGAPIADDAVLTQPGTLAVTLAEPANTTQVAFSLDGQSLSADTDYNDGFTAWVDLGSITRPINNGTHTFTAAATDHDEITNSATRTVVVQLAPPPAAPVITTPKTGAFVGMKEISLAGTAARGTEVVVYLNGSPILPALTVNVDGTFTGTLTLVDGKNTIQAAMSNRAGEGPKGPDPALEVTCLANKPAAPVNFRATALAAGEIRLTWNAVTDPNVIGVNLYRAAASPTNFQQLNTTPLIDRLYSDKLAENNLADGLYYYRATAVNKAGVESDPSEVSATSDHTPPQASIEYTAAPGTPYANGKFGVGQINIRLTMSEPLMTTPFLSIVPNGSIALSLALLQESATVYTGKFTVSPYVPSGTARAILSALDTVGNHSDPDQSKAIVTGATLELDTEGPAVMALELTPAAPIHNDPDNTVQLNVKLTLSENPVPLSSMELDWTLSNTHNTPQKLDLAVDPDGSWKGTLALPPNAGQGSTSGSGEWLAFTWHATDELGNIGTRINGRSSFEVYQGELPALVPPILTGKSLSGGRVELNWNRIFGASDYELLVGLSPAEPVSVGRTGDVVTYVYKPAADGTYRFGLKSVRVANGQESLSTISNIVELVSDSMPPSAPSNVQVQLTGQGVLVTWDAATNPGGETLTYALYRSITDIITLDGLVPLTTGKTSLQAVDANPGTGGHFYTVATVDAVGNVSAPAPSAYINPELLPVKSLSVAYTIGAAPVLFWDHANSDLAGFDIYTGEPGAEVKLNQALLTAKSFTDTAYHGGECRYVVQAVDQTGHISPGRSIVLPAVELAPAPDAQLSRGELKGIGVNVANLGASNLSDARLNLIVGEKDHVSLPFTVAGGQPLTVPVVVGGYTELPNPAAATLKLVFAPESGESITVESGPFSLPVVDPTQNPYVFQVVADTGSAVRGGNCAVHFRVTNNSTETVELVTARDGGSTSSNEVRLKLLDGAGTVVAEASLRQYLGDGLVTLSDKTVVARLAPAPEPGYTFECSPVSLHIPAGAPDTLRLRLEVDQVHYHFGKTEHAAIAVAATESDVTVTGAPYTGLVTSVSPASSMGNELVVISGTATTSGGQSAGSVPLKLTISNRGFDRVVDVTTGADGTFSYTFPPNPDEGGVYETWANHPLVSERQVQQTFTICHLRITPANIDARLPRNYPASFQVKLEASPGTAAGALHVVPQSQLPIGFTLKDAGSLDLADGATGTLNFILGGDHTAPETGDLVLDVTSDNPSGKKWGSIAIHFTLTAAAPALKATPTLLQAGVKHGESAVVGVTVENVGLGPLADMSARLLDESGNTAPNWLVLNGSLTDGSVSLPLLAVGGKQSLSVTIAPGLDVPITTSAPYHFTLKVDGANSTGVEVPVYVYVGEAGTGNIQFKVTDLFYDGISNHGVTGAHIQLVREDGLPGSELNRTTDLNGEVLVTDLSAGRYKYRVTADKHDGFTGWVQVQPGLTVPVPVSLQYDLVTIEWEVRPTTITDSYEIVLHATFETQIPAPVLIVEPVSITLDPAMPVGTSFYGELKVTNQGLIRCSGIRFVPPDADARWKIDYLLEPPDTLEPQGFFIMPYKVTRLSGVTSDPCSPYIGVGNFQFQYLGGDAHVYTSGSPVCWVETILQHCLEGAGDTSIPDVIRVLGQGEEGNPMPGVNITPVAKPLCDEGPNCKATVKIEIQQELSFERQAFDAHLKIANGASGLAVTNLQVVIRFKDAAGNPVLASTDSNDTTAMFFIRADSDGLTFNQGVWSAGDVIPNTASDMHWLIIPAPGAGGTAPKGTLYYVGATVSYNLGVGGQPYTKAVMPDSITVLPMPQLQLDYFLPLDVYGDDPDTLNVVEPEVPFTMGLLLRNTGYGEAKNMKIESGQPKIVENKQGLLVKFTILGAEVNDQAAQPSFTVDFGTVPPGGFGAARWAMTASLCGRFVSFDATYTHADNLGGTLTSLIKAVHTHGLLKDVLVDQNGRDAIADFLGYERSGDGTPVPGSLAVYETDGPLNPTPVADQSLGATLVLTTGPNVYTLDLGAANVEMGFVFVKVADPLNGVNIIAGVTRSDGRKLPAANAWLSREKDLGGNWSYYLNIFDYETVGKTYAVSFTSFTGNRPPVIGYIGPRSVSLGGQLGFVVRASDPDKTVTELSADGLPPGATFIKDEANSNNDSVQYDFYWQPGDAQQGEYYVTFTAYDPAGLTDSETVQITVGSGVAPLGVPEISQPAEGLCIYETQVQVSGIARDGDSVILYRNDDWQGELLPIDRIDRTFTGTVLLVKGVNLIRAAAANGFGTGPKSNPVTVIVDQVNVLAPANLTAISLEQGVVRLKWLNPKQVNLAKIVLYRALQPFTDAAAATVIAELEPDKYTFDDKPLADGDYYYGAKIVKLNGHDSPLSGGKDLHAVSDSVLPVVNTLTLTPSGNLDPATGRIGPGAAVAINLTVSEPLLAAPFLCVAPTGGVTIPVALTKVGDLTFTGAYQVTTYTPTGPAHLTISMRDLVGNRQTELPAGAGQMLLDTRGPVVTSLSVNPAAPLDNNNPPVTVSVTFHCDEGFPTGQTPQLNYALSASQPASTPVALQPSGDGGWTGSLTLPATAGATPGEKLNFTYRGTDDLGNVSNRIEGCCNFEVYQGELPALAAPTGLHATARPGGVVELVWNDVRGAADYLLYRAVPGGSFVVVSSTSGATGWLDTPGDGDYRYAVSSIRSANGVTAESEKSGEVQVTADSIPPNAPGNLRLTLTGKGVKAEWDAPVPFTEEVKYNLYRSNQEITALAGLAPVVSGAALTSAIDPSPTHNSPFYAVAAVDAAGNISAPSPTAFLDAELLPVGSLTVEWADPAYPVLNWTKTSSSIQGYYVYAGDEGREVRLSAAMVSGLTYTDLTYNSDVRRYMVTAVDQYGRESLGRSVTLVPLGMAVEDQNNIIILRGEMNPVNVSLTNPTDLTLDVVRAGITVGGHNHVSQPLTLQPLAGTVQPPKVVVGGYATLPDSAAFDVYAEIYYGEVDKAIVRRSGGNFNVTGPKPPPNEPYTVTVETSGVVAGGGGNVRVTVANNTFETVEFITAAGSGTLVSPELRVRLLDADGVEIGRQAFKQTTGGGVFNLATGQTVARIGTAADETTGGPARTWTSDWVYVTAPLSAKEPLKVLVDFDNIHYRTGEVEEVIIGGFSVVKDGLPLSLPPYTGQIDSINPPDSFGNTPIGITGHASAGGTPKPNVEISLILTCKGFVRRVDNLLTDSSGSFSCTFVPLPTEGGVYSVAAVHPAIREAAPQAQFVVRRLIISPNRISGRLPRNYGGTVRLTLTALAEAQATCLKLVAVGDLPTGVNVYVGDPAVALAQQSCNVNVAQLSKVELNLTVVGDNAANGTGSLALRVVSNETTGTEWGEIGITYELIEAKPVVVAKPVRLSTGVAPGGSVTETVTLENDGFAPVENAAIELLAADGSPAPDWIVLGNIGTPRPPDAGQKSNAAHSVGGVRSVRSAGADKAQSATAYRRYVQLLGQSGAIDTINPGEKRDITLTFAPDTQVPANGTTPTELVLRLTYGGTGSPSSAKSSSSALAQSVLSVPSVVGSNSSSVSSVPSVVGSSSSTNSNSSSVPSVAGSQSLSLTKNNSSSVSSVPSVVNSSSSVFSVPSVDKSSVFSVASIPSADSGPTTFDVPIFVYINATGQGNLLVQPLDLYSGSGMARPETAGVPRLTLRKLTGTPVPDVEAAGDAEWNDILVHDLPAGLYEYHLSAPRHDSASGQIEIKPGVTETLQVMLTNTLVTVEWEVKPTTIQDQYELVLTANYETSVPAPVLAVSPVSISLPDMKPGEVFTGELLLENKGLIRADEVQLIIPDGKGEYSFEFQTQPTDRLEPNQFVRLPYRVTRLASAGKTGNGTKNASKTMGVDCGCISFLGGFTSRVVCQNGHWVSIAVPYFFTNCIPCPSGSGGIPVAWHDWGGGWPGNYNDGGGSGGFSVSGSMPKGCANNGSGGGGNPPGSCRGYIKIEGSPEYAVDKKEYAIAKRKEGEKTIVFEARTSGPIYWSCGNQTGSGSIFTVDFKDFELGKYEVKARTKISTGEECSDTVTVYVMDVQIRVDLNHDFKLDSKDDDKEIKKKEFFEFWVNNWAKTGGINGMSDLENFALMEIAGPRKDKAPEKTEIVLAFEDSGHSGTPRIRLFSSNYVDYRYLENTSNAQFELDSARYVGDYGLLVPINLNEGGGVFKEDLNPDFLHDQNYLTPFIFEGISNGQGTFSVVLKVNGKEVFKDSVKIKIADVDEYYSVVNFRSGSERWDVDHRANKKSEAVTVFIHGYNVSESEATGIWFPTMFKRLYWTKHTADFIGVTWRGDFREFLGMEPDNVGGAHFDEAMFQALSIGKNVAGFLTGIKQNWQRVDVIAHSLGNAVVGRALFEPGPDVQHFILAEAAVAAECFDQMAGAEKNPDVWSCESATPNWGHPRPDGYWAFETDDLDSLKSMYENRLDCSPVWPFPILPLPCDDYLAGYFQRVLDNHPGLKLVNRYSPEDDVITPWWLRDQHLKAYGRIMMIFDICNPLLAWRTSDYHRDIQGGYDNTENAILAYYYPGRTYAAGQTAIKSNWYSNKILDDPAGFKIHSEMKVKSLPEKWDWFRKMILTDWLLGDKNQ